MTNCKKPIFKSFSDILREHQWRKTEEAVYNINNEFENYTFQFENAEDCEKNSFMYLGKDGCDMLNLCNNTWISYQININGDSLIFIPYDYDTISVKISRFIEYYDNRSFILKYDTLIENYNKKIKETYTAF
ncbi:MAG: hypothetical protein L3J35_13105 [Bacteroidales bacterium]|nr:hypothetical protein [Bacteroidales bacterium]